MRVTRLLREGARSGTNGRVHPCVNDNSFYHDGIRATEEYCRLAREHGLDPAQMALACANSRPFLTSNIIGARTMEQLRSNIQSMNITLTNELLEAIEAVHNDNPNPCP